MPSLEHILFIGAGITSRFRASRDVNPEGLFPTNASYACVAGHRALASLSVERRAENYQLLCLDYRGLRIGWLALFFVLSS